MHGGTSWKTENLVTGVLVEGFSYNPVGAANLPPAEAPCSMEWREICSRSQESSVLAPLLQDDSLPLGLSALINKAAAVGDQEP